MAKVIRRTFNTSNTTKWKTFLDDFECPLLSITATASLLTILVDNTVQLNLPTNGDAWFNPVTISYDGSTTGEVVRLWFGRTGVSVTVATTATLFYIQFQDGDSRRLCFVYEICDGLKYYGYRGSVSSMNQPFYDLASFSLTKLSTLQTYTHKTMLNYNTDANQLDYIEYSGLIDTNNVLEAPDTNFISCTSVSADMVYTLDGNNYYAVGTNNLILME